MRVTTLRKIHIAHRKRRKRSTRRNNRNIKTIKCGKILIMKSTGVIK